MAELPITFCNLQHKPTGPGDRDGYRWHVGLEEDGYEQLLVVDISASEAVSTELGTSGLTEALPDALQRYARGKLKQGEPVMSQVAGWNGPILLQRAHFD